MTENKRYLTAAAFRMALQDRLRQTAVGKVVADFLDPILTGTTPTAALWDSAVGSWTHPVDASTTGSG
jgi:hypothetical protein